MGESIHGSGMRELRIHTPTGSVDGTLEVSHGLRTLDHLNLVLKSFVNIRPTREPGDGWPFGPGLLAVNKDCILFVQELSAPAPRSSSSFGSFSRSPVRLRVDQFTIEGFVHVPHGGSPMKRLDQDTHAFVPLTTVLVSGPAEYVTAPFLAVNRRAISAAQALEPERLDDVAARAEAGSTPI
jgi:hypothetical protein